MNRRIVQRLALILTVCGLLGIGVASTSAQQKSDPVMFRGNPAHTGEQPGPAPQGAPKLLWRFQTGDSVRSSPVVADGIVYFGSNDKKFYAVDAKTGETKWTFQTGGGVKSPAAVADGLVYFGSNDRNLYALDAKTGEQKWVFTAGRGAITTAPTVVNGVVYVGIKEQVEALDAKTGAERWHFVVTDAQFSSPSVVAGGVYVGSSTDTSTIDGVYGIDVDTGHARWNIDRTADKASAGADASSGSSDKAPPYLQDCGAGNFDVAGAPVVVDGAVLAVGFVTTKSSDRVLVGGLICAMDAETGNVRWVWGFPELESVAAGLAVSNDVAYVASRNGYVYAVDTMKGDQLWGVQLSKGLEIQSSPTVVGQTVYVASFDHHLYALDTKSGAQQWQVDLNAPVWSSPAVVDGVVYVGSDDGFLYAISGS